MKICIVCSPGGHLIESLALLDAFKSREELILITHQEKFEINLPEMKKIYFLKNLLIKKVNSTNTTKKFYLIISMFYLFIKEFFIILNEKPDIIISTGSEIAIPAFLIAKMLKIESIFVESLTRIEKLSGTGKILLPISSNFLVQWPQLAEKYDNAIYKGNILKSRENTKKIHSKGFIFVTVGTASFDRLVILCDNIAKFIEDKVIIQRGRTNYKPKNADYFDFTKNFTEFNDLISEAKVVISHAGVGTILNVLDKNTPLIVVPRIKSNKEHIDDHQLELSNHLEEYSIIRVAKNEKDIIKFLKELKNKQVHISESRKDTNNDLIEFLKQQLSNYN